MQFRSKNLTHFTNLNSLDIENNILPQHSQKPFRLYIFSNKHVSVWFQKKHLGCAISWHQRTTFLKHFESKCLYISVYLCKKNFWSKHLVTFYLMRGGLEIGGRLKNFLMAARCLGFIKCFTIFHFNWTFLKFKHFSAFWYFHPYHQNAQIFQTVWTSRVRLWPNFS